MRMRIFKPSRLFALTGAGEMKHYEEIYDLYELGRIDRLQMLKYEDKRVDRAYDLIYCSTTLGKFINAAANQEMLPASIGAARKLHAMVEKLWKDAFDTNVKDE